MADEDTSVLDLPEQDIPPDMRHACLDGVRRRHA